MKRGYRSPRNIALNLLERHGVASPGDLVQEDPMVSEETAELAFQCLCRMKKAVPIENGRYEYARKAKKAPQDG